MRVSAVLALSVLVLPGCLSGWMEPPVTGPLDYLTDKPYTRWVIETDYVQGHMPDPALRDFLSARLAEVVRKPAGLEFRMDDALAPRTEAWSTASLVAYAQEHRSIERTEDTVVTHLMFLQGGTTANNDASRVLGLAIGHDLIVIFVDAIEASCDEVPLGLFCSTGPIYRATTLHEFGHILGLVNRGIPMVQPHEAETCNGNADDGHSHNQGSVMYCAVATSQIALLFGQNPPDRFDDQDRADLRRAGGR